MGMPSSKDERMCLDGKKPLAGDIGAVDEMDLRVWPLRRGKFEGALLDWRRWYESAPGQCYPSWTEFQEQLPHPYK